jgi:hypothetical protein
MALRSSSRWPIRFLRSSLSTCVSTELAVQLRLCIYSSYRLAPFHYLYNTTAGRGSVAVTMNTVSKAAYLAVRPWEGRWILQWYFRPSI